VQAEVRDVSRTPEAPLTVVGQLVAYGDMTLIRADGSSDEDEQEE